MTGKSSDEWRKELLKRDLFLGKVEDFANLIKDKLIELSAIRMKARSEGFTDEEANDLIRNEWTKSMPADLIEAFLEGNKDKILNIIWKK